jgi:hypothetical protein
MRSNGYIASTVAPRNRRGPGVPDGQLMVKSPPANVKFGIPIDSGGVA